VRYTGAYHLQTEWEQPSWKELHPTQPSPHQQQQGTPASPPASSTMGKHGDGSHKEGSKKHKHGKHKHKHHKSKKHNDNAEEGMQPNDVALQGETITVVS